MANDFYNHDDGYPAFQAQGASAAMRAQFDKIQAGFDKFPTLTGNGGKPVAVNAAGTALEAITAFTDTTFGNVSTLAHGFVPKLPGNAAIFFNGAGAFTAPPSASLVPDVRTSNTILAGADNSKLIQVTTGGFTQTVTAAATLGSGWFVLYWNNSTTSVTIDPNGAETINGAASLVIQRDQAYYIVSNGTNLLAVLVTAAIGDHTVVVNTGNGFGSTNTAIRRFTTTVTNVGTAVTYADSATLGGSFTINEAGFYSISYTETGTTTATFGVSINSAQLTTAIETIAAANRLTISENNSGTRSFCGVTVKLAIGDVVRAHSQPGATFSAGASNNIFSIRKVGFST